MSSITLRMAMGHKICKSVLQNTPKLSFFRCTSTAETLEPVSMSYTSYESASGASQAPPLIILHCLFGSKRNWNSLCNVYNKECIPSRNIIALDARNHGNSAHCPDHSYAHLAADIKAFYDQLNIKKAVLMGHSMGGRAMMMFALKYPNLVDKLIVGDVSPTSTNPDLDNLSLIFRTLKTVTLPAAIPMSQARADVDAQLSKSLSDMGLRKFLLTNLVKNDDGSYGWRINIPGLHANFDNLIRFPQTNDLIFRGPVLFVAGGESGFVQKNDYPKILKLFPKAELKYIEGAGHRLHSEKPEEFLKITLEFLNRNIPQEL